MEFVIKCSLSLISPFPFSLALPVRLSFSPFFGVVFISSVFWGCVTRLHQLTLMPNLLLCLIMRLRISPPVIQFNYSETRSAAVELRRSTSWDGFSPTRDVAGCGIVTAAAEPRQVSALQYNCLCLEQAERVKDGLCSILVNALTGQRHIIIMNIIITVCDNACKVNVDPYCLLHLINVNM